MPARNVWIKHTFNGGWATDFGPTVYNTPEGDGTMKIPFLVNARNLVYEFDGGPHKAPGRSQFNSTATYGGATGSVVGLFDYCNE